MTPLEAATIDELTHELLIRFEHGIFIGMQNPDGDDLRILRRWTGNSHTCVGLAWDMSHTIAQDCQERSHDDNERYQ